MNQESQVPDIFLGQVPQDFYEEALRKYQLPRKSRVSRFLNRMFFRYPEESIITDTLVRSLYGQALALRGEEEARSIAHLDSIDEVTGLSNRRYFLERGSILVENVGGRRKSTTIGGFMDIVDFGELNKRLGHDAGDIALSEVGDFICSSLRTDEGDIVCRWGGDEYAFMVNITDPTVTPREVIRRLAERLAAIPFDRPHQPMQLRFGFALLEPGMDAKQLIKAADVKGPNEPRAIYTRLNPAYLSSEPPLLK